MGGIGTRVVEKPEEKGGDRGRTKIWVVVMVAGIAVIAAALLPALKTDAYATYEHSDGTCSNCHGSGGESLMTVSGLPTGTYAPGASYTITISIADANGAGTGTNAFDLLITGGTLSTSDPNVEINNANAEASTKDSGDLTVATWALTWTAPSSGSVQIQIWGVYGVGPGSASNDLYDYETYSFSEVPEFPALLIPVVGMLGAALVMYRSKGQRK